MAPPARTITVALDMSKAFNTISIHTLIRKLLHTMIPGTIINSKLAFHKAASFPQHYSTFTQQTYHHPEHRFMSRPTQMTSTHTSTSAARKYIQPYIHKVFVWTKQNNLTLNPDKTTCTLFTPDPAEYKSNLDLKINNTALPLATHPKVMGLTLDPKPIYSTHIHKISVHAHKPLQMIKALTATGWGKQKETLMATYKAVMRPALEYASSIWSPLASSIRINKLQVMQNAALRTVTGCPHDANIQHMHDETLILPIHEHLQLHASQYKPKTEHPSHPLHKHTTCFNTPRLKKTLSLTTTAAQQTFPHTTTQSLQQT